MAIETKEKELESALARIENALVNLATRKSEPDVPMRSRTSLFMSKSCPYNTLSPSQSTLATVDIDPGKVDVMSSQECDIPQPS